MITGLTRSGPATRRVPEWPEEPRSQAGTPRPLFEAIAHHLADDGIVFFSTALESAQRDHTYEFHRESEPLKMAEEVGLRVTKLISDAGSPVPGGRFLPRALGMILRKR